MKSTILNSGAKKKITATEEDRAYEIYLLNNNVARKQIKEAYESHKAGDLVDPRTVF